jgi:hypothetical protein
LIRINTFHLQSDAAHHQKNAIQAANSAGTKIITVGIGGADLALSDTVSNSVAQVLRLSTTTQQISVNRWQASSAEEMVNCKNVDR